MGKNSDPSRERKSLVYFIRTGAAGAIKIGTTKGNPHARLRDLQTGNPEPIALIAAMPGDAAVERQLHERFAESRQMGEWFTPTERLLGFIEGVAAAHALPVDDGSEEAPISAEQYEAIEGFVRGLIASLVCERNAPILGMRDPSNANDALEMCAAHDRVARALDEFQTHVGSIEATTGDAAALGGARAAVQRFRLDAEQRWAMKRAEPARRTLEGLAAQPETQPEGAVH